MIHTMLLPLLISLLGLALGYLLAFLAPEEVKPGKNYFRWLKRVLFAVFWGIMVYELMRGGKWFLLAGFTIVGLIIMGLDFTIKFTMKFTTKQIHPGALELATYAYFGLGYFLLPSQQLLLASIIFLYGLPAGTMLRKR